MKTEKKCVHILMAILMIFAFACMPVFAGTDEFPITITSEGGLGVVNAPYNALDTKDYDSSFASYSQGDAFGLPPDPTGENSMSPEGDNGDPTGVGLP